MTRTMTDTNWVYIQSEPELWTVGFYDPANQWHPESDHSTPDRAANRVSTLNGGTPTTTPSNDFIRVPTAGNVGPTEYLALVCAAEVALAALNWLRQNPWMGYGDVVNKFGDRIGDDLAEALDSHLAQTTELDPETNVEAGQALDVTEDH